MKNKNIQLSAIAFVLLVIGVLVNDPFSFFADSYAKASPLVKSLHVDRVGKITVLSAGQQRYSIKKSNEAWLVYDNETQREFRADKALIENSLKALSSTRRFQEATANKDRFGEFHVTDNDFKLEIYAASSDEKPQYTIILGANGPNFNSTVVRLQNESTAYVVEGSLKSDWDRQVTQIRDRSLLHVDVNSVQTVLFNGKIKQEFHRKGAKDWELHYDKKIAKTQSGRVDTIVSTITTLQGNSFTDLPKNAKAFLEIDLATTNGMNFKVEIFEQKDAQAGDQYFARSNTLQDIVSITKAKVDEIIPPKETYIAEEAGQNQLPIVPNVNQ